jgi:arginyl-tRNA synthetase
MQEKIKSLISKVIESNRDIDVEIPKNEKWGDYSTNIALIMSKQNKTSPQDTADQLSGSIKKIDKGAFFSSIETTPQGFVNFRLSNNVLIGTLKDILQKRNDYGSVEPNNKKVLLEFVSANPTGPLHIGHGRWAVIGDCIANVLTAAGYKVDKEFYVNDAGEQVSKLVESVIARIYKRALPEDGYAGSYIQDEADYFTEKTEDRAYVKEVVLKRIIAQQQTTLEELGVKFDKWFSEELDLHKKGLVEDCIKKLEAKGLTFTEENALWFKSMEYGDDKNRVLRKDDGNLTYFAADIAYHMNKFDRGYDKIINVWGTDHHGYVARLKAAMTALGYPAEKLIIIIGQLVALYRGKELIRMSKRTGEMITLNEVIAETGSDATRYFLAKNSPNTHLDFDLELAKSKTMENPVYYVGYAHARICSIKNEADKIGIKPDRSCDMTLLSGEAERKLIVKLVRFPDEVMVSARLMQPHRLTAYAEELAALFHNYYHFNRILTEDKALSTARLTLAECTSIVLRNVLLLLGIKAPEKM